MFINQILIGLKSLSKPQCKFLTVLFTTFFVCPSKINFSSLARYSSSNEKTYRRNFRKTVDFIEINQTIINYSKCRIVAFAMDASFIGKSGKETFGLDKFWNGCASRAQNGLEASIISLIDARQNASFALTVDQTEPQLSNKETDAEQKTRIDFYAEQVEKVADKIRTYTNIGLFDGFYAKEKFVTQMDKLKFTVISRLRQDANLKYLYEGEQKKRGRPRKYDGKVDFQKLTGFIEESVKLEHKEVKVHSKIVWSVSLERKIKVVVVKDGTRSVNLFSTDVQQEAGEIFRLYRSRFTIEFLIRDAKQSAGLNDCQARDNKALEFHWNTALTTVNLARAMAVQEPVGKGKQAFSMKTLKQQYYNDHLVEIIISKLGIKQRWKKWQEKLAELRNYAVIHS